MKINRMFTRVALLLALSLVLAACSSAPASTETTSEAALAPAAEIVMYNWTDYMNPDILSQFEQETGIRVIEDYFSSNEEMIAKLQGGATGYSLVIPSDYAVAILKEQGLITPLNHSEISNLANLNERFKTNE